MSKYKPFLLLVVCILLTIFVMCLWTKHVLPAARTNTTAILIGNSYAPLHYRLLSPLAVLGLTKKARITITQAETALASICFFILFLGTGRLSIHLKKNPYVAILLVAATVIPIVSAFGHKNGLEFRYVSDIVALLFSLGLLSCILSNNYKFNWWFLIALGTFNRETTLVWILVATLLLIKNKQYLHALFVGSCSGFLWILIKIFLTTVVYNEGGLVNAHHALLLANLHWLQTGLTPINYPEISRISLLSLAPLGATVLFSGLNKRKDSFHFFLGITFLILTVTILSTQAMIWETRVFLETVIATPLLLPFTKEINNKQHLPQNPKY